MKIHLQELLSSSLNSVFTVEQLFEEIKKSDDENIVLDFHGVTFITASFAQAYIAHKLQSDKKIEEINLTPENETTLDVIKQKHKNKILINHI